MQRKLFQNPIGFSLIELMVSISLLAMLAISGIPSFLSLIQSNRVDAQANDFISHLNFARSEAVKRATRITLCKSANQTSCTSNGDWDQGWIVFVDDQNQAAVQDPSAILRVHGNLDNTHLSANGSLVDSVSYNEQGFINPLTGTFFGGTFTLCSGGSGSIAKTITLNSTGRAKLDQKTCP